MSRYVIWSFMLLLAIACAVPITIYPKDCKQDFGLYTWDQKRFGPYVICIGGTLTFRWTGLHSVFQIPDASCPSNFTAGKTDTYQFLAPTSQGGEYVWKVPNKTGHYWVTSSYNVDCQAGQIVEVFVVDPEKDKPFPASGAFTTLVSFAAFIPVIIFALQPLIAFL